VELQAFFSALDSLSNLTSINLNFRGFDFKEDEVYPLTQSLRKMRKLKSLALMFFGQSKESIDSVLIPLSDALLLLPHLSSLDLSFSGLSITSVVFLSMHIADLDGLSNLTLSLRGIQNYKSKPLLEVLPTLGKLSRLSNLKLNLSVPCGESCDANMIASSSPETLKRLQNVEIEFMHGCVMTSFSSARYH